MQNFVQPGNVVPLAAPYDVASGDGLLVGSIFGVATNAASNGTIVETKLVGVYDLKKKTTDLIAAGAVVYWDNTAKQCTVTATSNTLIGAATEASGSGATAVRVRLNGHFTA